MTWSRLVRRQAAIHRGTLTTMAALALVTSFLAAAAPRAVVDGYDRALTDHLTSAPELRHDVFVNGRPPEGRTAAEADIASPPVLDAALRDWRGKMEPALGRLVSDDSVAVRSQTLNVIDRIIGPPLLDQRVNLRYDTALTGALRYVEGGEPGPGGNLEIFEGGGRSVTLPLVEAGVSRAVADQFRLTVGDQLRVKTRQPGGIPITEIELVAQVSGIYEPIDPGAPVWSTTASLLEPQLRLADDNMGSKAYEASLVLSGDSYQRFAEMAKDTPRVSWHYRMDFGTVTVGGAPVVAEQVANYIRRIADANIANPAINMGAVTGLAELITDFLAEQQPAHSVLSLAIYAVLAVAITVLALAAQLAVEQRRGTLALMRARGGSLRQTVGLVVAETGAAALPAVIVGAGAALLLVKTRSPVPGSAWLVAAVAAAVVLLPATFASWQHRGVSKDARRDLVTVRPSPRRRAAEILVVALAAAGAYSLHRRGLTTSTVELGADPYLVALPVIIALAAGLLALRAYPYPLRALGRLTAGRRSAVPFLAVARASREAAPAALPLLALLMTLGLGVFGNVLDTSVTTSQDRQTWRDVGADVRLETFGFGDATVTRLEAVPGVDRVAPAYVVPELDFRVERVSARTVVLVAIDSEAYAPLVRRIGMDIPLPPRGSASGPAPALLSPDLSRYHDAESLSVVMRTSLIELTATGTIEWFPGVPTGVDFVVVPFESVDELGTANPTTLFVDGPGVTGEALTAAAGLDSMTVDSRTDRLQSLQDSPLTRMVLTGFQLALLALAVFSVLAVLLGLVLGADRRGRAISYLRTLGLSQRQSYGLLALEVGPLIGLAIGAGLVVGWLISVVVAPGIDLRPFTGSSSEPPLLADPVVVAGLSLGVAVVVGLAILVDAALNRRRRLGSVLRVGEQG